MPVSAILLLIAVLLVDLAWVAGVKVAAMRAYPGYPATQARWTLPARIIFLVLVILQAMLGSSGALADFEAIPPPFMFFMALCFGVAFVVAYTGFGDLLVKHLSFSALIGFQCFRILAEAVIALGVHEGVAPRQLSFHGWNFDIVTGVTALPVAYYIRKQPQPPLGLIRAWNWMGCAFLAVILFIATTSFPLPIRVFMTEPGNQWVTRFPYILLPGILVTAALTGHLLCFRKLKMLREQPLAAS